MGDEQAAKNVASEVRWLVEFWFEGGGERKVSEMGSGVKVLKSDFQRCQRATMI